MAEVIEAGITRRQVLKAGGTAAAAAGYALSVETVLAQAIYREGAKNVTAGEAPTSVFDLADQKWKGQVAIGHPGYSGSVGVWVVTMKRLYGWEFFEKLAKNGPQVGRSIADGLSLVESGERKVSLIPMTLAEGSRLKGRPSLPIYPVSGAVLPPGVTAIMER